MDPDIMQRGGSKQRAAKRAAQTSAAVPEPSRLATHLLRSFGWGKMSLPEVQVVAALVEEDALEPVKAEIRILANLGSRGLYQGNLRRDLLRHTQMPALVSSNVCVPIKKALRAAIPFLDPVDVFRSLQRQPMVFRELCCRNDGDIANFWREVGSSHPALLHHPVKKIKNYQSRAVPLILHGDGVPIDSKDRSCAFISWRSLLSSQTSSKLVHVLISAVWTEQIVVSSCGNTVASIWGHVVRAFERCFEECKTNNDLFPVLLFLTGDLEWYNTSHNLPRWNSNFPCGHCNISKDNMFDYKNVAEVPVDPWHCPRRSCCPLLRHLVSPSGVIPDWMHSKHLGFDQRLAGSTLWVLCWRILPGGVEENLDNVLLQMKDYWRQHKGNGINYITQTMVLADPQDIHCRKGYPRLKAKAAETKGVIAALASICQQHLQQDNEEHQQIALALSFSRDLDQMADGIEDWKPSKEVADRMMLTAVCLFQCMTILNKSFLEQGHLAFQLTFKTHWFLHGLQLARHLSPKLTWTYSGEDYMSKCKGLLKMCTKSRTMLTSLDRFMRQYTDAMSIELAEILAQPGPPL
ncbi:unnamed protein product [Symbiodinium sp. CCMP2592]|nr:unnamed protein product [Symbiodinium sp. CCMP2592]CAE7252177.1 unnamed protein product [Symbiodinium sp. CCMP2592]CAE7356689.1 unnamed protein product [Symbiodinium sp. CCMP2592]CAE7399545.1 unnamed protein product [Symbiodinium sp. CCMP2592]CAE7660532.1 unnamed protein product [Symbiodinium sp. CCMP2592]